MYRGTSPPAARWPSRRTAASTRSRRHQAGLKRTAANTGAVTLIQRFGSAANLNIHLHCLVLDGVYRNSEGAAIFHEAPALTIEELHARLAKIITRIMRLLTRQGFLIEEQDRTYLAEADRESALLPLQAASCTYRIALGPRAGQKVLSLQSVPSLDEPSTPGLRANPHGFSLHAAVRWGAESAQGTGAPVPLYHPPGDRQRTAQA